MPVIRETRICRNPHCAVGEFTPEHGNQYYCDNECYRYWNNHKQKVLNGTIIETEKQLRLNQKVLQELYTYEPFRQGVELSYLKHKGMNVKVFSDMITNADTDGRVYWSHNYGIEAIPNKQTRKYFIYQR